METVYKRESCCSSQSQRHRQYWIARGKRNGVATTRQHSTPYRAQSASNRNAEEQNSEAISARSGLGGDNGVGVSPPAVKIEQKIGARQDLPELEPLRERTGERAGRSRRGIWAAGGGSRLGSEDGDEEVSREEGSKFRRGGNGRRLTLTQMQSVNKETRVHCRLETWHVSFFFLLRTLDSEPFVNRKLAQQLSTKF